jgi:hypothetical protein
LVNVTSLWDIWWKKKQPASLHQDRGSKKPLKRVCEWKSHSPLKSHGGDQTVARARRDGFGSCRRQLLGTFRCATGLKGHFRSCTKSNNVLRLYEKVAEKIVAGRGGWSLPKSPGWQTTGVLERSWRSVVSLPYLTRKEVEAQFWRVSLNPGI